ncbi:MAG: hypothetical protein AB7V25_03650 [Mangrovibacterium sp.]
MTKRISHIILSLLLIIFTAGVSISRHFCGGELAGVSLFSSTAQGCSGESSCSMGNCCHDEHQLVRMQEDFVPPFVQDLVLVFLLLLAVILVPVTAAPEAVPFVRFSPAESLPPPGMKTRLTRLQVFRL